MNFQAVVLSSRRFESKQNQESPSKGWYSLVLLNCDDLVIETHVIPEAIYDQFGVKDLAFSGGSSNFPVVNVATERNNGRISLVGFEATTNKIKLVASK